MDKPTFLTKEEKKAQMKPEEEKMETAQDPEPTETTEPLAKTTVKERIEKINRRIENSPGKFPEMKQTMIKIYFSR